MTDLRRSLYSAAQVRELDRRAIHDCGIPGHTLMQRAASACWRELRARWPQADFIEVVCGPGNNGGDGYEIARLAVSAGRCVRLRQIGAAPSAGDAALARQAWERTAAASRSWAQGQAPQLIVDALFGTGLARPVEGEALAAIESMRRAHAGGTPVLAVDIPSGLCADSGCVLGAAVEADLTVTFIASKLGLFGGRGVDCAGEVVLDDLDVPHSVYRGIDPLAACLQAAQLAGWLPRRRRDAHKGAHGHVLVVGGDAGMSGAALLAAQGALRAGAGLVSVATRARHAALLSAAQPEIMSHAVESAIELAPLLARASVVALGPGLGQEAWGRALLARVLESKLPLVVDADGLNLVAQEPLQRDGWIVTPHPGEAARLLRCSTLQVQNDRVAAARQLRARLGAVVVLKGAGSLVQGDKLALCPYGNPGMAVGGMGDVLSGVIAALLAQGLSAETAAQAGVLAHALAGDAAAAAGERGLLPTDLLGALRAVINP